MSTEINASSMADIAFLLLIFFLVTTTMDVDKGLLTKLPPIPEEEPPNAEINNRNAWPVLINSYDQLLVKGELMQIEDLKKKTKEFIDNNGKNPALSDNPDKAVVSLKNDRGTSYNMYIQVQNEIKASYSELRNEAANKKYGRNYDDLKSDDQKKIRKMYPMKVSEAEPEDVGGEN